MSTTKLQLHSMNQVKWDAKGLIPAIAQDMASGEVLMLAWMNREALEKTLETGYAVYWSRSRNSLWFKGETSGHTQRVHQLWLDCDNDALLLKVAAQGGVACHTGRPSCFFQPLHTDALDSENKPSNTLQNPTQPCTTHSSSDIFHHLAALIHARKNGDSAHSYVARLFALGDDAILKKVGEEATEVVLAAKDAAHAGGEAIQKLISEMADLWFHCLITLGRFDLSPAAVFEELERRQGLSGLDEKAARNQVFNTQAS